MNVNVSRQRELTGETQVFDLFLGHVNSDHHAQGNCQAFCEGIEPDETP